jgi:hypothetical protein
MELKLNLIPFSISFSKSFSILLGLFSPYSITDQMKTNDLSFRGRMNCFEDYPCPDFILTSPVDTKSFSASFSSSRAPCHPVNPPLSAFPTASHDCYHVYLTSPWRAHSTSGTCSFQAVPLSVVPLLCQGSHLALPANYEHTANHYVTQPIPPHFAYQVLHFCYGIVDGGLRKEMCMVHC